MSSSTRDTLASSACWPRPSSPRIVNDLAHDAMATSVILETVRHENRLYLAMIAPRARRLTVNGTLPPPLAILQERDQIAVDDGHVFYLSIYSRPFVGPPRQEDLGRDCPICLTPIDNSPAAETTIYVCPYWITPTHVKAKTVGESQHLECLKLISICSSCQNAIIDREGFSYVPEF